jgi:outer membrane protein TolC
MRHARPGDGGGFVKAVAAAFVLAFLAPRVGLPAPARAAVSLSQAENLALAHSDSYRAQSLRVQSSSRRIALGIRDFLPSLSIAFTTDDVVSTAAQDSLSEELSLTVSQPLFSGGRTVARRALARLELALARHSLAKARSDVLNAVWELFHTVLVLRAQAAVKNDSLAQSRRQLAIAGSERASGMIREIDLLEVELAVSNQEVALQETETDLDSSLYALKKCLGMQPDEDLALEGSMDSTYGGIVIRRTGSSLASIARLNNLDVLAARYAITQRETQLSMLLGQSLPDVAANVAVSVSGAGLPLQTPSLMLGLDISFPQPSAPVKASALGGMPRPGSRERYATLSVSPLESVTGALDASDARLQLAEARTALDSLMRDLGFQIGQSLKGYQRHVTTIALERRGVELERRKLLILEQQVASGSATRVEYLKERVTAADREVSLLSDIMSLIKEERALERLIGLEPGALERLEGGGDGGS